MRIARVEAEGDAPAGLSEHDALRPNCPLAGERPVVGTQVRGKVIGASLVERATMRRPEVLRAPVAEIRLARAQVRPVGLGLDAESFDADELTGHAQQTLDDELRFLVASLAEVLVADDAVSVGEVERWPEMVVERA